MWRGASRDAWWAGAAAILLAGCSLLPSPRPSLDSRPVDAATPVFSDPTAITNPLLPAATLAQVVQLGVDGGEPLRVEVTLMPETRSIAWNGDTVETVVVQFIAYRNRHVIEVAYDYFAQADDGSVWYFGEVVDNYGGGSVTNHSGSWLAGEDGPPGMIMPASPSVGDVYHPENIPGVVFEELIVLETGLTAEGPSGPIAGVILVEEHLMDGGMERKLWAPGYGEFKTETTGELVAVAVASPTDALSGPAPAAVLALHAAANRLVESLAAGGGAGGAEADVSAIRSAWDGYRAEAPPLVADEIDAAVAALSQPSGLATAAAAIRQAGIDLQLALLDLELRFRQPAAVDLDRMAAWMQQLRLDVEAQDRDALRGDAAIASVIWARCRAAADAGSAGTIDSGLARLDDKVATGELAAASTAAESLLVAIGLAVTH